MAVLIACSMLKDEIEYLKKKHEVHIKTIWIKKGLHEFPDKCRAKLQNEIDDCNEPETILFAYGMCGNATLGLQSGNRTLVIPKFDDCIRMLLAPGDTGKIRINPKCLYFTDAWVDSDKFLFRELDEYPLKYGETKGNRVAARLIQGYEQLCMIHTGVTDSDSTRKNLQEYASRWNLGYTERTGSKHILELLLMNNESDDFCRIGPYETVQYEHFEDRIRCSDVNEKVYGTNNKERG